MTAVVIKLTPIIIVRFPAKLLNLALSFIFSNDKLGSDINSMDWFRLIWYPKSRAIMPENPIMTINKMFTASIILML